MYKILKQGSKDIKDSAKIHRNIGDSVFLQYCEKLRKTTNVNELELKWNLNKYLDMSVTLDEL